MTKHYIVRVELNSNNYIVDFTTLHSAMQRRGFSKTITSSTGVEYHLPRAEYSLHSGLDIQTVFNLVKAAVFETKKPSEILVTESSNCTFELKAVR